MAEIKWIKLDKDIFNNRKIRQIEKMQKGDTIIVIWLKLLMLAGTINDGGQIYLARDIPYTEEMLAAEFGRPVNTVRLALETFKRFEMICIMDGLIWIRNWERYQNVEGMEKVREQNRKRKQAQRDRERDTATDKNNMSRDTSRDGDTLSRDSHATEEEREEDIEKKEPPYGGKKEKSRFVTPSVEEVREYCLERGNGVDPEHFVDHYSAIGWKIGKAPMKDWKAAVRTWEKYQLTDKRKEKEEEDQWFDAG